MGTCGAKRKSRDELEVLTAKMPLQERSTFDGLAAGLDISIGLAHNLLKEEGSFIQSVKSTIKPSLPEAQKWERVEWCLAMIDSKTIEEEETVDDMLDESWFLKTEIARRYFLTKGEKDPYRSTQHKSHIEKIMFLSAIARPRYDPGRKKNWDGKVLCEPIGDWVPAKKNSCRRPAGTLEWKNRNVDGDCYVDLMKKVVDNIIARWPRCDWRNPDYTIYVQNDGAPGHKKKEVSKKLNAYLKLLIRRGKLPHGKIVFVRQPAQSPDLNVNDLGVSAMQKAAYRHFAPQNAREIIDCVLDCWSKMDPVKINRLFLTQDGRLEQDP